MLLSHRLLLGVKPRLSSGSFGASRTVLQAKLPACVVSKKTKNGNPPYSIRLFTNSHHVYGQAQSVSSGPSLKPYYVTTPIFYVNADPHIGHLYSSIVADVLARYHNLRYAGYSTQDNEGHRVPDEIIENQIITQGRSKSILSTGTDEHGLKIQKVAEAASMDPKIFCNKISHLFKDLAIAGQVDFTRFIRTTEDGHREAVQHLWSDLESKGFIYKGTHEGWYAVSDEAFYPESQVHEVTKDGKKIMVSIETGSAVEWSSEENYKFRLSAFREDLIRWLENDPTAIQPLIRHTEVLNELKSGLSDLSISRPSSRLSWGIPVPGDPNHSIYVWMDALTNYLTVNGYPWKDGAEQFGWPADVHVVGKDILRFHTVYWPAFLLAAGLPLPKTILAHSHWTVKKAKMSKSTGNVIDPFEAISTFGPDTIRFYLMRVGGNFDSDSDYSPDVMLEFHRKFLKGQLGNLLSRISAPAIQVLFNQFAQSSDIIHRLPKETTRALMSREQVVLADALESALIALPEQVDELMSRFEFAKALELILESTIRLTNEFVHNLSPWSPDTPAEVLVETILLVTESLRICATLLRPFMPTKMDELLDVLQVEQSRRADWNKIIQLDSSQSRLHASIRRRDPPYEKIKPLFPRIG